MRDIFLRASVALAVAAFIVTEVLSAVHLLSRGPLIVVWLVLLCAAAVRFVPRWKRPRLTVRPVEAAITFIIAVIAGVVAFTAWISPPNSADAMAYHMPRVFYWAQSGSVSFFPTSYFNQISLQPLMEYCVLHTYLISGGDHFVNLLTCSAFFGAVVGVSSLAGALGLSTRGQAFAALFCATLPGGILQASGAKNDCMLAFWLVCAAYWLARENAPLTGLSLGLVLATKATAYLFAPPLMLAVLLIRRTPLRPRMLAWMAGGVLLLNSPLYIRNLQLSGSPLGYDSAQGDGVYRWRNDHPGWKPTVSNLIRHTSEQLGSRNAKWNESVFHAALTIQRALGIDPDDPGSTWRYAQFTPPKNANHEADGNSRWHLLLLLIAGVFVIAARKRPWIYYSAGLLVAFLIFCFFLKWQPYMARMELPLFVLASPLAAAFLDALRPVVLSCVVCVFLLSTARLPLLQNWTRPLQGPHTLLTASRDENYFRDMIQWNNRASYVPAVDLVARSGCTAVGIDISQNQVEYPLLALLRERNPAVRIFHTGVENASAQYTPKNQPPACAVICPDCEGIPHKLELYKNLSAPIDLDRFLVFLPPHQSQINESRR